MAREFGSGTWRYVNLTVGGTALKYVFLSKLKDSLKTEFGQTDITSTFNIQGAVLSPNKPKPYRASKRFPDGYEGSYCSSAAVKALKADGYSITKPKFATANQTKFSRVLFVTLNGVNYAWRRPRNAAGDVALQDVGAQDASGQLDLVFGADFPKPAQAKIALPGQGSYQSYVDDSKVDGSTLDSAAVAAGWNLSKGAQTQLASLLALTIGES